MQFEPRLFTAEPLPPAAEPRLTADLPDELAALAEQLQDDSARLAERYPPPRPHARSRHWAWAAAVAAVSFTTGVGAVAWWTSRPGAERFATGAKPEAGASTTTPADDGQPPPPALKVVRFEEPSLEASRTQATGSLVGAGLRTLPRPGRLPVRDEAALLRRQVTAFELVIERLQSELRERADQQSQTDAVVAELRREIEELRSRLDEPD